MDELRAQPVGVVYGLMHRIFARRIWNENVAAAAHRPISGRPPGMTVSQWGEMATAQARAKKALAETEHLLWPED